MCELKETRDIAKIKFLWKHELVHRRMRSSSNGLVPRLGVNIVGCR